MNEINNDQVDQALTEAFATLTRPLPSLGFNPRLREALIREKLRRKASRTRVRIMQIYWMVAAIAVACILSVLPWAESSGAAWAPLLVVATLVALPILLVRIDLFDLIVGSIEEV